jgi:hypothetical protein
MSETNKLTPSVTAETARNLWLFTLYLCNGIVKGKINYTLFQEQLDIEASGKRIYKIYPQWQPEHIELLKDNLQSSVLGTVFLVLDQQLDRICGKKPKQYNDSDLDALRAIIFMLRCAFAHATTNPRWRITNKQYKRLFCINTMDLEIDFSSLDGELISLDWAELCDLMNYAVDTIKWNETNHD